nr:radical SAM protein [bacterium]
FRHVYGPVPSRRLGRSLGVDLVPFKVCTYDCVYCQLGRTTEKTLARKEYVPTAEVVEEIGRKLSSCRRPDYISIAGSGEPTLHTGIGDVIDFIKRESDVPVAVITNGSLLWMPEVSRALMAADLVIPSLDAGDEKLFRKVNRPHPEISFERMFDGIASFTKEFKGEVWLEVFLLGGISGVIPEVKKIASLVERIAPARVQLNTVARPTAEDCAAAVTREEMENLARFIPGKVEIVSEAAGCDSLPPSGGPSAEAEIVELLKRRPCTVEGIALGLGMSPNEALKLVDDLMSRGEVVSGRVGSELFYSTGEGREKK